MTVSETFMEKEAKEAPQVINTQWQKNHFVIKELLHRLKNNPPSIVITIGRGSSDHATTFAKYLFETKLGLPTASAAPSVLTLYGAHLNVKNALVIAISQSGKSPDICETLTSAKENGAITVAMVNETNSPLAEIAEYVLPLHAGEEKAVAATKSYLASLAALIDLIAHYAKDKTLLKAMNELPDRLRDASQQDWSLFIKQFKKANDSLVLARGYGLPVAQEAALKLKETLSMHAEAFSAAEVIHGPFTMIRRHYPLLMLAQGDVSLLSMLDLAKRVKSLGAKILLAAPHDQLENQEKKILASSILPLPKSLHPICDPLVSIQAFYPAVAQLAKLRGFDPDSPKNLQKVTETR